MKTEICQYCRCHECGSTRTKEACGNYDDKWHAGLWLCSSMCAAKYDSKHKLIL